VAKKTRKNGQIVGRVRDTNGDGIKGVDIRLQVDAKKPRKAKTDARGVFDFSRVTPGLQVISVVATGRRPVPPDSGKRSVLVEAGHTSQVGDILLEQAVLGTITGFVRVATDGQPLKGVSLGVRPLAGGSALPTATTNKQGKFTAKAPLGTWEIEPDPIPIKAAGERWVPKQPDRGTRIVQVTADRTSPQADPIVVVLAPAVVSVTGTVRDANSGSGLVGVRLRLRSADGGGQRFALSSSKPPGRFAFTDVLPGLYLVDLEQRPFDLNKQRWEPVVGDTGVREVTVEDRSVDVEPLLVQPERHRIFGTVARPDDSPVRFIPVHILNDEGQDVIAVETDFDGNYEADVAQAGRYIVELQLNGRRIRRTVTVASDAQLDVTVDDTGTSGFPTPSTSDFAAFPVLTETVTVPQALAPSGAPPSSVSQTVESALREALGWRPRAGDTRGFSAALVHSFELREVQGHTEAVWTPRTYAAQVQADLGAITGAQASVYSRARVALGAALPLLDGLYPLDPAADPQDTEAIRSIIRSELSELVAELGVEGGPRLSRVDDLLDLLLRRQLSTGPNTTVAGQLAQLQHRFGLVPERVETVAEEEDVTNFLILRAYVEEIDASWTANRGFFDPTSTATPFLGTQLVLLSRSLSVVAESVTEVNFTLDSVFLGAAERLAIRLSFPPAGGDDATLQASRKPDIVVPAGTPSILLGELLSWVERVASEEGPQLLQDGGRDGATALTPVLEKLRRLVRASLVTTGSGPNRGLQSPDSVPAGYATQRVQRALAELAKYLDDTTDLASRIQR
jgi:hypothetical protein